MTAAFAVPAFAQELVFTVVNNSGVDLTELYASPANAGTWEENILGGAVMSTGASGNVNIANGAGCEYDLKMVFSDGDVLQDKANLCDQATYTIN
jgi:hypothetical protein